MRDFSIVVCFLLMFSETIYGQRDKWSWSSNNNNNNNRNSIDDRREREFDRRKYESLEDFRSDRYEVNEASTRKPNSQGDEFFNNGAYGINQGSPLGAAGNGYNSNGFGAFPPQGLGAYPPYANGGPYNQGFGNFRPGLSPNYPNSAPFNQNFGNAPYYPGAGGYPPNRFNGYNPLGNNAANGILVGPGGPTGLYGRPPNQFGPFNQFGAQNQFGAPNQFGYPNQFGGPYNNPAGYYSGYGSSGFGPGVPPVGPGFAGYGPFNSKGASGILADESGDDDRRDLNKENKSNE